MKINRLETHDRLQSFYNQGDAISQACITCIANVPDEVKSPFYVFAHPRSLTLEEQKSLITSGRASITNVPTSKLIWAPRITKPKAQTNSYLFLARKGSDEIRIIWKIPPRELWEQYAPGKMTHDEDTWVSIQNFQYARKKLEERDLDGPTEQDEFAFFRILGQAAHKKKEDKKQTMLKQSNLVQSTLEVL